MKTLFICTGNTCRSPMAAALYNVITGGDNAFSAGLSVSFGGGAAQNAQAAVLKYGVDLSHHISHNVTLSDIDNADTVITMTLSQKDYIKRAVPECSVLTLAEFAGKDGDITDPFGGSQEVYNKCAAQIYQYIKEGILQKNVFEAQTEDAPYIAELENECLTDSWSESSVKSAINDYKTLVYKEDGVIYGYCIFMNAADEGEVLRIAVKEEKRGKGIGMFLLNKAVCQMKEAGAEKVYLEVREGNIPAVSLYTAAGFLNIGVRKNYYRDTNENALIFALE